MLDALKPAPDDLKQGADLQKVVALARQGADATAGTLRVGAGQSSYLEARWLAGSTIRVPWRLRGFSTHWLQPAHRQPDRPLGVISDWEYRSRLSSVTWMPDGFSLRAMYPPGETACRGAGGASQAGCPEGG